LTLLLYLYANTVRVLRQVALNTFIDLNIQARVCPRVIKKSAQGCLHIQTLGDICSRLRKGEKLKGDICSRLRKGEKLKG
jgi:hypothetical protein